MCHCRAAARRRDHRDAPLRPRHQVPLQDIRRRLDERQRYEDQAVVDGLLRLGHQPDECLSSGRSSSVEGAIHLSAVWYVAVCVWFYWRARVILGVIAANGSEGK
mmetsp:Transcript_58693/g.80060  ORF Transcript_58693/g.80060 Transcript_58693/m.80060 type:complete len:105 (+) Transcript_58693:438-752(+)